MLTSRLFWKTLGIYFLLSSLALGGVIFTNRLLSGDSSESGTAALNAAISVWLLGVLSASIALSMLIIPLRRLSDLLQSQNETIDRHRKLSVLMRRKDEIGEAAIGLYRIDQKRDEHNEDATRREQQAQSSTRSLSAVLQAMVEGVLAVDGDEKILFANTTACAMLELDADSIGDRQIFECIRSSHVQEAYLEAVEQQETVSVEFRLPRNENPAKLVASPVSGGGAVLVLEDVSEVRKLETMRRDFVNGVSHELKTPLTVIQACTETLLDGACEDTDAAKRFLGQIQEQSERLLQMILGMLQLARVESGQQLLDEEPVDLFDIASHVVAEMKPVAEGTQKTLDLIGETELFVLSDYQAIRTVVSNLVDNALKYTNEGGHVCVKLSAEASANVIRISDDGIGIPKQDQERIFERFYRVQRDRNREGGGTGLGLAIVKHLCEAMGAHISLSSDPGKGTTFDLQFPFRD